METIWIFVYSKNRRKKLGWVLSAQNASFMHNRLFPNMRGVLNMYNAGMPQPKRKESKQNDTLFPTTSKLIKKRKLNESELEALEAFITSLSTGAYKMRPPELPQ